MYASKMEAALADFKKEEFFLCIGNDQWEHHFEATNYLPLQDMTADAYKKHSGDKDFIKLAKMYPLSHWDNAGDLLLTSFSAIIKWLTG